MASSVRANHVSAGVYSREEEIFVATKSLGITTLGLVGETQRGPAFEPIRVENWREFQSYFGSTSTEKFKGTKYPKYELPYIAKSYLSESNQLEVCRVLGLSGYNAGPAWVITLEGNAPYKGSALAVLRSRGYYDSYYKGGNTTDNQMCGCESNIKHDYQRFLVGESEDAACRGDKLDQFTVRKFNLNGVKLTDYNPIDSEGNECEGYEIRKGTSTAFVTSVDDYGKFNIQIWLSGNEENEKPDYIYSVSLNKNDKDYILKVLGTNNNDGVAPIYVEALYDVALEQGVSSNNITGISRTLSTFTPAFISDYCKIEDVADIMHKQYGSLTRLDANKRFIADGNAVKQGIEYHVIENGKLKTRKPNGKKDLRDYETKVVEPGHIYIVKQFTVNGGKRKYFYIDTKDTLVYVKDSTSAVFTLNETVRQSALVKIKSYGLYFKLNSDSNDIVPATLDLNNYKSRYQFASTPWFVSNVKGDYKHIEVNRLFRFHTISDGDNSNYEVKVSIENIRPDEGTFDVVVRDINDTDAMTLPLEKFSKCSLVPGTSNFIGFKIGTFDGDYESRSKYITVELYGDGIIQQNSVPCGFLGYPHGFNQGDTVLPIEGLPMGLTAVQPPVLMYNKNYDEDTKARKQYFGLSSISGVDVDAFTFKGNAAYVEEQAYLTNGFHLDCRMNDISYDANDTPTITVDGEEGFVFDTVSVDSRTLIYENAPIIGTEDEMQGSIFELPNLRKFTCYFYGGFDGWDVYRQSRTNTDEFKMTKYRGQYDEISGEGYSFDKIKDPELLGLNQNGITSDFYAYLAAYRQFSNPEAVDINIFATPGIDLINNTLLSQEVIEMLEQERADSIYVATLPDKPSGANDYVDEMYSPDDIVAELEDTEIDSNYTCTYYPWVKYFDNENSQYIMLPATKDVVRNMAQTDNQSYSWFPPAGLDRGDVQAVKAHYVTRLSDEDVLYNGRINPIKSFSQDGVKIWGQKNLSANEDSQLNRIAVRRLLLRMRKLISTACLGLIFMPNDNQTKQSLQGLITPIMDNLRSNRAVTDYRIEITSSDATTEDRRELFVRIAFKPLTVLEYISLTFSVYPEGVSFDDI